MFIQRVTFAAAVFGFAFVVFWDIFISRRRFGAALFRVYYLISFVAVLFSAMALANALFVMTSSEMERQIAEWRTRDKTTEQLQGMVEASWNSVLSTMLVFSLILAVYPFILARIQRRRCILKAAREAIFNDPSA